MKEQSDSARPTAPRPDESRADLAFAILTFGTLVLVALAWVSFPATVGMLLLSGIVAYAVLPLVDRVGRFMPRTFAVLVVALGFVGALVLLIGAVATSMSGELTSLGRSFGALPELVRSGWARVSDALPALVVRFIENAVRRLSEAAPKGEALSEWAIRVGSGVTAVASALVFVPIFVFLMLRGYHPLVESIREWLPPRWRPTFAERGARLDRAMSGFVRGQLAVSAIISVLYVVGFSIIGLPLAVGVGVLAGFGELIPYLGGAVALTLGILLALGSGELLDVVWVVVVFTAVQALEGTLLSPWIVGRSARLGALTVLVALAVGAQLFGFLGLLLAVPGAVVVKAAWAAMGSAWRGSRFYWRGARV